MTMIPQPDPSPHDHSQCDLVYLPRHHPRNHYAPTTLDLHELLALANRKIPLYWLDQWSTEQREQAADWARREILWDARDRKVDRVEEPEHVQRWQERN